MGLSYPRDNGKVFFIFRVLMNINGIPNPFLCFLFPLGSEIVGGKLSVAEREWNVALDAPNSGSPHVEEPLQQPRCFPFLPNW